MLLRQYLSSQYRVLCIPHKIYFEALKLICSMHRFTRTGFFLILVTLILTSCKTKQYTFDTYDGNIIAIGSSGGFTGATSKYYIFENGQLFRSNRAGESPKELTTIDPNLMKQQFENYYTLGFDTLELDDAGNMSYFIIMNPNTDKKHMIKWGGGSTTPSPELEQYYNLLSAIVRKHSKPLMNTVTK